jgi:hypothetical protein
MVRREEEKGEPRSGKALSSRCAFVAGASPALNSCHSRSATVLSRFVAVGARGRLSVSELERAVEALF